MHAAVDDGHADGALASSADAGRTIDFEQPRKRDRPSLKLRRRAVLDDPRAVEHEHPFGGSPAQADARSGWSSGLACRVEPSMTCRSEIGSSAALGSSRMSTDGAARTRARARPAGARRPRARARGRRRSCAQPSGSAATNRASPAERRAGRRRRRPPAGRNGRSLRSSRGTAPDPDPREPCAGGRPRAAASAGRGRRAARCRRRDRAAARRDRRSSTCRCRSRRRSRLSARLRAELTSSSTRARARCERHRRTRARRGIANRSRRAIDHFSGVSSSAAPASTTPARSRARVEPHERLHRRDDARLIGHERRERAERHRALHDPPAAVEERGRGADDRTCRAGRRRDNDALQSHQCGDERVVQAAEARHFARLRVRGHDQRCACSVSIRKLPMSALRSRSRRRGFRARRR